MGAAIGGVSGARSQPLRLRQGLSRDGQARDEGYATPPAMDMDSSNWAIKIHPDIPIRNTFGSLAMAGYPEDQEDSEAEDEVRDVDTEEVMEDADSGLPDLPDRDENGRLVDKRGIERAERKKRESRDVDVEDVGGEARSSGGEEEQARRARVRAAPGEPTKAERERHNATHLPYQSWCRFCVKGRGRRTAHCRRSASMNHSEIPVIVFDYHFMADEDREASRNPMLGMRDLKTGNRYMRAVGQKGLGNGTDMDWLIKDMHEAVSYTHLTLPTILLV